jgi:putative ABC transport system permease protein
MIKNYLTIAWRNLTRNKASSLINITGLAIGMACVTLILFYVQDELKYDRFFTKANQVYQVNLSVTENGIDAVTGNTAPAVGPALVNEFPEIETYVRINRPGDRMVRYEENDHAPKYFTEMAVLAVDSNFFQVFDYPMSEGDPATCLMEPGSVVITEKTAKKYFGSSPAIGKTLLFDTKKTPLLVRGVLNDLPSQSSLQFDMLVPISSNPEVRRRSWNWFWLQVSTYVKLADHTANDKKGLAALEAKFEEMVKKNAGTGGRGGASLAQFIQKGNKVNYHLQPLTSVHLYSSVMDTESRITTLGNIKYVYIFSAVALIIIILACVNFMNLSTAQSARRAKEIGIRKVMGSMKKQLVRQFLAEALLYSFIAAIISWILVLLLLKPFGAVAGKTFAISSFFTGYAWLITLVLPIVTGLLAGSYPAFYISSFKPITALRGLKLFRFSLGNLFVRNGLVVFQFTISTALIISTIVVYKQLQYTRQKDLGFDKENIVAIANSDRIGASEESFRQELTRLPGIVGATSASCIPTRENFGDSYVPEQGGADEQVVNEIGLSSYVGDYDYISTMKMEVINGRGFSKEFSDSASVILNETAVKQIGWKNPVGKILEYPGNQQSFKVIGVVRDFNIGSLENAIPAFALFHSSSKTYNLGHSYILARMKPGDIAATLSRIEKKWKTFAPNTPFDYSFLDSELDALYRSEQRMGTVFLLFTVLSIFIACLGLFGLAAYTAEKRTKEIGIRKVLGASVHGLVGLLSKDFLRLVLLSAVIAFPIAWWFMHKWLQDFAYRTSIEWWVFMVAGMVAILIAVVTVSFQAIRAAIANPVKSLRTE